MLLNENGIGAIFNGLSGGAFRLFGVVEGEEVQIFILKLDHPFLKGIYHRRHRRFLIVLRSILSYIDAFERRPLFRVEHVLIQIQLHDLRLSFLSLHSEVLGQLLRVVQSLILRIRHSCSLPHFMISDSTQNRVVHHFLNVREIFLFWDNLPSSWLLHSV